MSITVRLWSDEDLQAIAKDKWLATIFMNCQTFSPKEIAYYPHKQRRVYQCGWIDSPEPITIYATDARMLLKFIDAEYTRRPDWIYQKITQYRPVQTDKEVS